MKKIKLQIILCATLFLLCGSCYAGTDSLPTCINTVSFAEHKTFTEYDYKGQRWFSFTTRNSAVKENVPDKLTTIRFYDSACHLKATWMKGGVAGFNKIQPDTIEKEKIITVRVRILDTSQMKDRPNLSVLPDPVYKLASERNSYWIEETPYKQQGLLYRLRSASDNPSSSTVTFEGSYYDKKGTVVVPGTITGKTSWWHYYGDRFYKTQFRPGFR